MATRKRTVEVEVVVDDKQAKQALGNIDKNVSKTGKIMSDFGKITAVAFGANQVVDFAREMIGAASDVEESTNAINVSYGKAAAGVLAIGENSAESFGLAKSEFNELAVGFQAFASNISQAGGGDVASVVEGLTTRIADFASVMNLDVTEAADKFRSGLAGETEPLRKFGIDVSAAAVNTKALELGLGDANGKLSEGDKVLARYQLIMEQTEKTAGDFANTSDSVANKQRIMAAQMEDAKATMGQALIPTFASLLGTVNELVGAFDTLGGVLNFGEGEGAGGLLKIVSDVALWASGVKIFENVAASFNDMVDAFDEAPEPATEAGLAMAASADEVLRLKKGVEAIVPDLEEMERATKHAAAAEEDHARRTEAARKALRDKDRTLRNIHNPLFRAVELNEDLAEAELAVEKASKKGVGSDEYRAAVIERAKVIADLTDTVLELKEDGIDPTGSAARQMLSEMGIPQEVIDGIFADIRAIEDRIESSNPRMTVDMFLDQSGLPNNVKFTQRHEGGVVPGTPGENVPIMAQAGEHVTRRSEVGHGGGATTIVHYHAGTEIGNEAVLQELLEMARRQ